MSETDDSNQDKPSLGLIFIIFISSIIIVFFSVELITSMDHTTYNQSVNLIGAIGTITLSGILAYLYYGSNVVQWKSTSIQNEQKKILNEQQDFLEATYKPAIIIDHWKVNENSLKFNISNVGNGVANDITTQIQIDEIEPSDQIFPEREYDREIQKKLNKKSSSKDIIKSNLLEGSERNTIFHQEAAAPEFWAQKDKEPSLTRIEDVFSYLNRLEPDKVIIQVALCYRDLLEKPYRDELWSVIIPYDEEATLEELLSKEDAHIKKEHKIKPPENAPKKFNREIIY